MEMEIDMSELTEAAENMYDMVTQRWPRENNKWMRAQGREGRKIAAGIARQRIKRLRPASNKKSYMARLKVENRITIWEIPLISACVRTTAHRMRTWWNTAIRSSRAARHLVRQKDTSEAEVSQTRNTTTATRGRIQ